MPLENSRPMLRRRVSVCQSVHPLFDGILFASIIEFAVAKARQERSPGLQRKSRNGEADVVMTSCGGLFSSWSPSPAFHFRSCGWGTCRTDLPTLQLNHEFPSPFHPRLIPSHLLAFKKGAPSTHYDGQARVEQGNIPGVQRHKASGLTCSETLISSRRNPAFLTSVIAQYLHCGD